jgi:hypothetical protein
MQPQSSNSESTYQALRAARRSSMSAIPSWAIAELMRRRRVRSLHRLGPISMTMLLAKIQFERGAAVIDLRQRRRLHLAPAERQAGRVA